MKLPLGCAEQWGQFILIFLTCTGLGEVAGVSKCPNIPDSSTSVGMVLYPHRLPDMDHRDKVVTYNGTQYGCNRDYDCARKMSCIGREVPCCMSGSCQCLYGPDFKCPSMKIAASARTGFCNVGHDDYVYSSWAIYRGSGDESEPLTLTATPASRDTGGYAIIEAFASTALPENYQYHVNWYMQFNLSPGTTSKMSDVLKNMLKFMRSEDILEGIEPNVLDQVFELRYGLSREELAKSALDRARASNSSGKEN